MNLPEQLDYLIGNGYGDVIVSDGVTDWTLRTLLGFLAEAHRLAVLLPQYRGMIEFDHDWTIVYGPEKIGVGRPGLISLVPIMEGYVARPWYVERENEEDE